MKKAIMVWTLITSLVGQDAIDAIYDGVLEGKSTDEIMQGIIEKRARKEKKLDKEIVRDLKKIGGVPPKAKGDPFKLAKGLFDDMNEEEYEKILGEDKKQTEEEKDAKKR